MASQTVNDEEKNYKKKIIENLNDEGTEKKEKKSTVPQFFSKNSFHWLIKSCDQL